MKPALAITPITRRSLARARAHLELPALHDVPEDDAAERQHLLGQAALGVCRQLRDAVTRDQRDTAIARACGLADEADHD
jgi:hypothetical protein